MGNFYITLSPRERTRLRREEIVHQEAEEELWFLDKDYYTKGSTFYDGLPVNKVVLRRWCQENLKGDVTVERGWDIGKSGGTEDVWTFWFEFEYDAVAFKLRWE